MVIKGGAIMKKIIIAFAALAAAFSLVSCNKEQIESTQPSTQKNNPSVEIIVNSIDGTIDDGITTKAAKTNWTEGDKINIWFDDLAAHKYGDSFPQYDEHFNPELVMTYDGSTWGSEFSSFFDASKLKANGRIRAIYESTNKLSDTFYYKYQKPGSSEIYDIYHTGAGTANHYMTPMIVSANVSYQYDSAEDKISANLSTWKFLTKVQVLVAGLKQHPSYYILDIVRNTQADGGFYRLMGFQLGTSGAIYPYDYTTSSYGPAGGTLTEEGMAFYFYDAVNPGEAQNYTFKIGMLMPPSNWTYGTATFENKVINTSDNKITCIKIDKSKFSNASLLK